MDSVDRMESMRTDGAMVEYWNWWNSRGGGAGLVK